MKQLILSLILFVSLSFNGFSQLCDETPFPYNEGFESGQGPDLPGCVYSTYSTFASAEIFETSEGPIAGFNNKVAQYDTASSLDAGVVRANLFAGTLSLTEGQTYNLSLRYGKSQMGNSASITINVLTPPGAGDFILLAQQDIPDGINNISLPFTVSATGNYSISVSVASIPNSGFVYIDDLRVGLSGTMGFENNDIADVAIYPNPVKNILNISNKEAIETVAIYSSTGQTLFTENPQKTIYTLNLEKLAAGIYFVNVHSGGLTKRCKIIKE